MELTVDSPFSRVKRLISFRSFLMSVQSAFVTIEYLKLAERAASNKRKVL
jgi:hypothetical protein